MRAWVALLVALSGCVSGQVWHQGDVQCEPMPWDGDEVGGRDDERIARLVRYYEDEGVDVVDARIVHHDVGVPAVCGAWNGSDYEIEVAGEFPMAHEDSWEAGPAKPPRQGGAAPS